MTTKYPLEIKNEKNCAKASGNSLKISNRFAIKVCRTINRMNAEKAVKFLEDVVAKKRSIDGKYYTNASKGILNILKSARENARFKNLDENKLIVFASAHKSFRFTRPRSRRKFAGTTGKLTNVKIILK